MSFRRTAAVAALSLLLASASPSRGQAAVSPLESWSFRAGRVHNHTGYSDGVGTPAEAFAKGKAAGFSFFTVTEHSNLLTFPFAFTDDCATDPDPVGCWTKTPLPARSEWEDVRVRAAEASDAAFVGVRGFEWSSDTQGHANVLLSSNYYGEFVNRGDAGVYPGPLSNAETTMDGFWSWLLAPVPEGGGADGLAVFNHPGREGNAYQGDRCAPSGSPPNVFEDFRYVPEADTRVVGVEVFNRGRSNDARYEDCFRRALTRGWHVGAVGAADEHGPSWDRADRAFTTLILEPGAPWTLQAAREAFAARRLYATRDRGLKILLAADGEPMGSRLARSADAPVTLTFHGEAPDLESLTLQLVGSDGSLREATPQPEPLDPAAPHAAWDVAAPTGGEAWWYLRVLRAGQVEAVTSPVWVRAAVPAAPRGDWLAGDLHVHTDHSHDVCATPVSRRDGSPCDEPWTWGFTPAEQIRSAEERGLRFLAITDHNTIAHMKDPGYASSRLILVPGQELSLKGHANVFGYGAAVDRSDQSPEGVGRIAEAVRAAGGLFQANHPVDPAWEYLDAEGDPTVPINSMEVWNIHWLYQSPPFPSVLPTSENPDALRIWERMLDRGNMVPATGGSDSHWRATSGVQGVGQPVTWVFAEEATRAGVLDGIRRGRVSISWQPPALGGPRLYLEADADRDGAFESLPGSVLGGGGPKRLRVRWEGAPAGALVRLVTNGGAILREAPVTSRAALLVEAHLPSGSWVRADLLAEDAEDERKGLPPCRPNPVFRNCFDRRYGLLALTGPLYVR